MKKLEARHAKILELLTKEGKVEVVQLSELFDVSQVTIRKDLDQLESKGLIKREHGFATLNSQDDMNIRLAYHYEDKLKIALLAVESIQNGETIMIESGSCCALFALEAVKRRKDLTIITNSAFISDYVRKYTNRIILLGGEYQSEAQVCVGPMTRNCVQTFHCDKFFIGADGFSKAGGFTGNDYMRAETVRDMAKQCNHVIVLTESSKFSQTGVVGLVDFNTLSAVYTDNRIDEDSESFLKEMNIEVYKTGE